MATNAEKLRNIVLLLLVLSWSSTAKPKLLHQQPKFHNIPGSWPLPHKVMRKSFKISLPKVKIRTLEINMGERRFMLQPSRDTTK